MIDPFDLNPAYVGTRTGVGAIVNRAAETIQAVPPDNPNIAVAKVVISLLKLARDTMAAPYNFACQKVKRKGTNYEIVPLDQMAESIASKWEDMTLTEKAVAVGIGMAIVATVALIVLPK